MKKASFLNYFLVMAITTIIYCVVYVCIQQSYRTGGNDPQMQIARDIAAKLQQGKSVDNFFSDTIDIAKSLLAIAVLYDENGKPMRSSGFLDGKMPMLPQRVFKYAKAHHEYSVTWQPQNNVRMAMVIESLNAPPIGFVASGRSLSEVEVREANLVTVVFLGWIICIGLILLYALMQFYQAKNVK